MDVQKGGMLRKRRSGRSGTPSSGGCATANRPWLILVLALLGSAQASDRTPVTSLLEMRQHHVVVQQWDLSCGAAALATILRYQYDDPVSEQEIAKALMKRKEYLANPMLVRIRHGFSLLDLKRYVDQRGYEGIGYGRLTIEDLVERAPVIVPLNLNGYNHFVVFRGVRRNQVLLADPAWGNRTMGIERFKHTWISYPEIGKIGFIVARDEGDSPAGGLEPRPRDFIMF